MGGSREEMKPQDLSCCNSQEAARKFHIDIESATAAVQLWNVGSFTVKNVQGLELCSGSSKDDQEDLCYYNRTLSRL